MSAALVQNAEHRFYADKDKARWQAQIFISGIGLQTIATGETRQQATARARRAVKPEFHRDIQYSEIKRNPMHPLEAISHISTAIMGTHAALDLRDRYAKSHKHKNPLVLVQNPYACLECGRVFRSAKAAERAAFGDEGCPNCGGSDIDYVSEEELKRIKAESKNNPRRNSYKRTPQTPLHVHDYEAERYGQDVEVSDYYRGKRGRGTHPRVHPTPRPNPRLKKLEEIGDQILTNIHAMQDEREEARRRNDLTRADKLTAQINKAFAQYERAANLARRKRERVFSRANTATTQESKLAQLYTNADKELNRIIDDFPAYGSDAEKRRWEKQVDKARRKTRRLLSNLTRSREKSRTHTRKNGARIPSAINKFSKMFHGAHNSQKGRVKNSFVSNRARTGEYVGRLGALPYIKMKNPSENRRASCNRPQHACPACSIRMNPRTTYLAATGGHKLAIVGQGALAQGRALRRLTVRQNPEAENAVIDLGEIEVIPYLTEEKHSDSGQPIHYYHETAEETHRIEDMPHLKIDEEGMLFIPTTGTDAGNYSIDERGIIN